MADLPEWVKALNLKSKIKYDEPPGMVFLQGSSAGIAEGRLDLSSVLSEGWAPGYRLSRVSGGVEHSRGHRFTWRVTWITAEEAERRYQEKQAARMSRFANEGEGTK